MVLDENLVHVGSSSIPQRSFRILQRSLYRHLFDMLCFLLQLLEMWFFVLNTIITKRCVPVLLHVSYILQESYFRLSVTGSAGQRQDCLLLALNTCTYK